MYIASRKDISAYASELSAKGESQAKLSVSLRVQDLVNVKPSGAT